LQITIQSLFYPFLCAFSSFCVFLHKDPAEMGRGQDGVGGRLTSKTMRKLQRPENKIITSNIPDPSSGMIDVFCWL